MHIENRSDSEPEGLLDGVNITADGMNMRINESRYNSAAGFAVCVSVCRNDRLF